MPKKTPSLTRQETTSSITPATPGFIKKLKVLDSCFDQKLEKKVSVFTELKEDIDYKELPNGDILLFCIKDSIQKIKSHNISYILYGVQELA